MTKYTYEEKTEQNIVVRTSDDGQIVCIPIDPANADYQLYLNPELENANVNLS